MTLLILNCSVCQEQLVEPVTLSCGFTVCLKCLPLQAAFQKSSFICPVSQCKKESHLFGPNLYLDDIIQNIINIKDNNQEEVKNILSCSIRNHLLSSPVTNHCGHTCCKLCLLQYKISNDQCNKCQKRLPSYGHIQQQSVNLLLNDIIKKYSSVIQPTVTDITPLNQISNIIISFLNLNQISYKNIPIYLSDFAVLPSQKLRIPIYTEKNRKRFQKSLLSCKEYQCLCLGIVSKDKTKMKGHFGTMVKITAIEQRPNDILVDVTGLDRFQIVSVNQETDDFIIADLDMKFEEKQDLENVMTRTKHWTEKTRVRKQQISPPLSPTLMDDIIKDNYNNNSVIILPSSPSAEQQISNYTTSAFKLSNRVHEFISDLAHSTPSTSFCSAVEGLLGPVWLDSVQGLHGPLPSADNAIAMCWWSAVVLPVSNTDRYHLLETISLTGRLDIILSWIHDLKSQWGNCRRTAMNSAAKVGQ